PSSEGVLTFTAEGGSAKIEHPSGSIFDVGSDGKFEMSKDGIDLRKLHDDMNDIVGAIVTNGGTNPNPANLAQLKTDTAALLK
ncbi:hypothetical protein KAR91_65205, partial [Candidatus Pacearchaeota archaeon]|nr:hypothetical protein [Candidatus Pacearchaeota archaeon]